tara:strand:- start:2516 stop:3763 length:1248 start_codon:yes stop_codon:yes gene_type:complete
MFKTIDVANNIIVNVENTTLTNRNTTLGQAYFIRAVTYFDLVRLFGGVPIRTTPVSSENLYLSRNSKEEVYTQIIQDFNLAKDLLPQTTGEYRSDRPIKWAANAYLAKVYMQLASEQGAGSSYWQNAWDEAIVVYGNYSLYPNYGDLFLQIDWVENTSEAIFELQYAHFGSIRNSDRVRQYTPSNSTFVQRQYDTFGWLRPNKEIFDQHNTQYPGDPRINATYLYGSYQRYNNNNVLVNQNIYPTTANGNNGYPYIKKWFDASFNGTSTAKNHTVFRYAELLLMLAEIENEINGPANAYQYVNQVLSRARNSVIPAAIQPADWSGMSQDEFRNRIMKERQYELFSEGQDWFDARRRGYQYFVDTIITVHNSHPTINVGNRDYIYPTDAKNMLLPIPQSEIGNNPNISESDQNPGY